MSEREQPAREEAAREEAARENEIRRVESGEGGCGLTEDTGATHNARRGSRSG